MNNINSETFGKHGIKNTLTKINDLENDLLLAISETIFITLLPIVIGITLKQDDPFLTQADFPWCILAPLTIGLRYGFIYGFSSAMLYVFLLYASNYIGLAVIDPFPSGLCIGLLLTGMLAGEFRDIWEKNNYYLKVENSYNENRLRKLYKGYLLLQVSHNLLEQKILGSPLSLRSIIMRLKDKIPLSEINTGSSLSGISGNLLSLFGEYGGVQIASLYHVVNQGESVIIGNEPICVMGKPIPVSNKNTLVQESLRTGSTIVASKEFNLDDNYENVIAVIPIVNTYNKVVALLTINEMVFVDYNYKTFDLLALIGSYIGDAVSNVNPTNDQISFTKKNFDYHVKRSLINIKRCDMSISLVLFNINNLEDFQNIYKIVRNNSRILDQIWIPEELNCAKTICLLLPLTPESEVENYINRIEEIFYIERKKRFTDSGINVSARELSKNLSSKNVFDYISSIERKEL